MHYSKEQRIEIYKKAISFLEVCGEEDIYICRAFSLILSIGQFTFPQLLMAEEFPELWNVRPLEKTFPNQYCIQCYLPETTYLNVWFQKEDRKSRIELLQKAIELCENNQGTRITD